MLHLNLPHLHDVLHLPCYIDTPIFKCAIKNDDYYTHEIMKEATLNKFLERIYDKVPYYIDCLCSTCLIYFKRNMANKSR